MDFIPKEEKIRRLRYYDILDKVEENVLQQIKLFHLVGDSAGTAIFVTFDNDVFSIGSNFYGKLGIGKTGKQLGSTNRPVKIERLSGSDVTDIYSGYGNFFVGCSNGEYIAWGFNSSGELGLNSPRNVTRPAAIFSLGRLDIKQISCGAQHTLALTQEGEVYAWGFNRHGQIGNCSKKAQMTPIKISGLKGVVLICCGREFSTALTKRGKVYTWGRNQRGQLGLGLTDWRESTVWHPSQVEFPVDGDLKIKRVNCGCEHVMALTTDNCLFAWGVIEETQIGTTPMQMDGVVGAHDIFSVWSMSSCAIKVRGKDVQMQVWKEFPYQNNNRENKEIKNLEDFISQNEIRGVTLTFQTEKNEKLHNPPAQNRNIIVDFSIPGTENVPDVHFIFGSNIIRAHKDVLQQRSSYFLKTFDWDALLGLQTTPVEIIAEDNEEGVRFEVFHAFLHYIYEDEIISRVFQDVFDLYLISGLFLEIDLQDKCRNILANELLNSNNVFFIHSRASFLNDENLEAAALRFMKMNYKDVKGRMSDALKLKMKALL